MQTLAGVAALSTVVCLGCGKGCIDSIWQVL